MSDIDEIIENGMVFRGAPKAKADDGKIKTKAKKKEIHNRCSWFWKCEAESKV